MCAGQARVTRAGRRSEEAGARRPQRSCGWRQSHSKAAPLHLTFIQRPRTLSHQLLQACCCYWCGVVLGCVQTLCSPVECSPPGVSVCGIFQARILEWVAISYPQTFPIQEWNPCLLHWKADSLPPCHLESPYSRCGKYTKMVPSFLWSSGGERQCVYL